MRNFADKICRENQNTHFMFNNFFFNCAVYKVMWKSIVKSRAGHRWQYGACALHTEYLRLQPQTLRIHNTYCFSPATTVTRTRLSVTLYVHCLPCFSISIQICVA